MPLYEVALLLKPTKKQSDDGAIDTIIMPPVPVVAASDKAAGLKALRDNLAKLTNDDDLSRVEVLVRPFA